MTSAALDIIIGAWLVVYAVPSLFDKETAQLVDVGIVILASGHIAARLR